MAEEKPIVIIKKKGGHGGHHGGAWKVAYADFVTAMMAFFMVMWLVNSAETATKQNIASYFRRPGIFQQGSGTPLMIGGAGILDDAPPPLGEEKSKKAVSSMKDPSSLKKKSGTDEMSGDKRITERGIPGATAQPDEHEPGIKTDHPGDQLADIPKFSTGASNTESHTSGTLDIDEVPEAVVGGANEPTEPKPESAPSKLHGPGSEATTRGVGSPVTAGAAPNAEKALGDIVKSGETGTKSGAVGTEDQASQGELAKQALRAQVEAAAEQIREAVASSPELQALIGVVDVKVEADGLNVEIMDTDKNSMFSSGSARISSEAQQAFSKIAGIVAKLPNKIDIVGHTDAKPFANRAGGYGNWELSADRANAARRLMEQAGVTSERFTSVVGRADKDLKRQDDPLAPANRRITLKMRFDPPKVAAQDPAALSSLDVKSGQPASPSTSADGLPVAGSSGKTTAPGSQPRGIREPARLSVPAATAPATNQPSAETVHSFTAKEIVEGTKNHPVIKLPRSTKRLTEQTERRENVFGDSPVIDQSEVLREY